MWYVCTLMFPIFLSQCFSEISHQELYDGLLFPSMPDGVYIPTQQSCLWHFGENHSGWCSATSEACIIAMVLVWFVFKFKLIFMGRRSYIFSLRFDCKKILTKSLQIPFILSVCIFQNEILKFWTCPRWIWKW